jgi:fumarylacetoacetate (FAA) hydrolase
MKLASLKEGRDGRLIIVSRDLKKYAMASDIAPTLQYAMDHWADLEKELRARSAALENNAIESFDFNVKEVAAPLPRAYQIADASAYLSHVRLTRQSRGAEMPPSFEHDPLIYQAVSSTIIGPTEDIPFITEDYGIDYEAEIAVITDDVPMGVDAVTALSHIKLVMLLNDVSLRALAKEELLKGFGFFNTKPPSSLSPVCVTLDELGDDWRDGMLHLPVTSYVNGALFGQVPGAEGMQFDFGRLIAHAAKTRPLAAGTIVGSGTVSHSDPKYGVSCIIEQRMKETLAEGQAVTPFLKFGDRVTIDMLDAKGQSVFGAIDQIIVKQKAA